MCYCVCIAIAKSGAVTACYAIKISAKFAFFTVYYMIRITLYFGCGMSPFSIGFHVIGMSPCITEYNLECVLILYYILCNWNVSLG